MDADRVPATIWLFDRVPADPPDRVIVAGRALRAADLDARATVITARLDCTSGWYADAEWSAVPLSELITAAELVTATSLVVTSLTGYRRTFPISHMDQLWLATRGQGRLLTAGRGAPVRLVAPGRRGFWWVKWVAEVELSDRPGWVQSPFPLQ